MSTFKQWQHWRWKGGGRKETPAEKAVKELHTPSKKDKHDCPDSGE